MKKRMIALLSALFVLCASLAGCSSEFDYMSDDLSEYIKLDRALYTGRTVEVELPEEIDAAYVDAYIRDEILAEHEIGLLMTDRVAQKDDLLALFYRVTVNESGETVELLSNIADGDAPVYQLGSDALQFGEDFDAALVGADMAHTLTKQTDGKVEENDIVYATYSYSYPVYVGDKKEWKSVARSKITRLDLQELAQSAVFGEDFAKTLTDKAIGKKHTLQTTFDADHDGNADEVTFTVDIAFAVKAAPISFSVSYPDDYHLQELAGKTADFQVCINGRYGTARELLTEKIVKETLKYEMPDEAEGDIVDAYISEVEALLRENREAQIKTAAVNDLWADLQEEATVIRYPESELDTQYDALYTEAKSAFELYNAQVAAGSLDEFIEVYYGVEKGTKHKEYFRLQAEEIVREQLIYYTIVQREKLTVTDADVEALRSTVMAQMIYTHTVRDYQTNGKWQEFTEDDIVRLYGEAYVEESVHAAVLAEKLQTFLYENMTVKDKPTTSEAE